jgi:hypothetical protein
MTTRAASCSCGQLRIVVHGEPLRVGICHCLACQQRTGSVFGVVARFGGPYEVEGEATDYVRVGDEGTRARFRFCPRCGSTVYYSQDGDDTTVAVPVGAFADPTFPAPQTTVYANRKHAWVREPPGLRSFDPEPE